MKAFIFKKDLVYFAITDLKILRKCALQLFEFALVAFGHSSWVFLFGYVIQLICIILYDGNNVRTDYVFNCIS